MKIVFDVGRASRLSSGWRVRRESKVACLARALVGRGTACAPGTGGTPILRYAIAVRLTELSSAIALVARPKRGHIKKR